MLSFQTLHGGQFTLSTQLITLIISELFTLLYMYSPTDTTTVSLKTPFIHLCPKSLIFFVDSTPLEVIHKQ